MLIVEIQPRLRHRHPVGGVTPNDSRNRPNKTIGLAGAPEISSGFLWIFPMRGRGRAANSPERQYFFSTFYPESGDAGSDV
jgi:hypothetical protein